jgi:hypothetical protein
VQGCKDKCFGVFLLCEAFEARGPYPSFFSLHRMHDCVGTNADACKLFSLIMAQGMELKPSLGFCLLNPNYFQNIKWVMGFGIVVILLVCVRSYVSKFKNQIDLLGEWGCCYLGKFYVKKGT